MVRYPRRGLAGSRDPGFPPEHPLDVRERLTIYAARYEGSLNRVFRRMGNLTRRSRASPRRGCAARSNAAAVVQAACPSRSFGLGPTVLGSTVLGPTVLGPAAVRWGLAVASAPAGAWTLRSEAMRSIRAATGCPAAAG